MSIDYDKLIVEIKRRYDSMNNSTIWEVPRFSNTQIVKAGKILINPSASDEEMSAALEVLNNWRSSHAYPLQVIATNLRGKNKNAIVVQRLKRLDSIIGKLRRFPNMSLYRMQDLGGCRVILPNVSDVYHSVAEYKNSRIRHILKREDDYIANPKTSGYRSYHLVYQFHSEKNPVYNKNMYIEIQFRTVLQHVWATAVEIMGIYTKTSLKSSIGDSDTLRFFALVSSLFAHSEHTSLVPGAPVDATEIVAEIKEIDARLNIVSRISALSTAINHVSKQDESAQNGYYILILDFSRNVLKIHHFPNNQIGMATEAYGKIEAINDSNIDSVLVAASSFKTLREAYPNYFVDIGQFVRVMRNILSI